MHTCRGTLHTPSVACNRGGPSLMGLQRAPFSSHRQRAVTLKSKSSSSTSETPTITSRRELFALVVSTAATITANRALAQQKISKVFVAGSTGATGRRIVQCLRTQGYQVRAGVRDKRKAQGLGFAFDPEIELVPADVTGDVQLLVEAIGDAQAVICATGYNGFNPQGFSNVDETGTIRLVDAAKAQGVQQFVLLSSLLTNAPAIGQGDNPNYKFLNLFGGVLEHKLKAEKYLRSSGLSYTIVRPGGLSQKPPSEVGTLIVRSEDTLLGLPEDPGREISRDTVAEVLVEALRQPAAVNKVVEVVASPAAQELPRDKWFLV